MQKQKRVYGFLFCIAIVAAALILATTIWVHFGLLASSLFYAAIILSAWYGGLGPGLLATLLSSFMLSFLFAPPVYSMAIGLNDALRIIVFVMVAGLISFLTESIKKAGERSSFLAEASRLLAVSLDIQVIMRNISDLVVRTLADHCLVDLVGPDGNVCQVTSAHSNPEKAEFLKRIRSIYPGNLAHLGVDTALRFGKAQIYSAEDHWREALTGTEEQAALMLRLGFKYCAIVPMIARERPIGAITVIKSRKSGPFSTDDLQFLEEIAARAALAADNAVLYRKAKEAEEMKGLLLKEVHHRVKNNLQIVSSLLHLQSQFAPASCKPLLESSRSRIQSIALIHEKLHHSETASQVDLAKYLEDLLNALVFSIEDEHLRVRLDVRLEPISVDMQIAINSGMIVNEIVSNSLKHAFKNRRDGKIHVRLCRMGEQIILEVGDNGPGIAPINSIWNSRSLGRRIVHLLANQLNARIDLCCVGGTNYRIEFAYSQLENTEPLSSKEYVS